MVDTHIVDKDNIPMIRSLFRKLARMPFVSDCQGKLNKTPDWLPDKTPYTAKKARRIGYSPADADMPSPVRMASPDM